MSLLHFCLHITSYTFLKNLFFLKGGTLFCTYRSVCRSVGRSVDHAMSAQYLLTLPNLAQWMLLAWE